MGQGEVGGVTCRVTCTWWLLGLAVKAPWLGPGGPILAVAAWIKSTAIKEDQIMGKTQPPVSAQ